MSPHTRALVAGAGAGLRSMAPLAVLAARGRGPFPGPARFIAFGAAAGELVSDKQPQMGSRWAARGLSLRVAGAALVGADGGGDGAGGGPGGAALAVGAALVSARLGSLLRARAAVRGGEDGGGRTLALAVAEDALCYALLSAASA